MLLLLLLSSILLYLPLSVSTTITTTDTLCCFLEENRKNRSMINVECQSKPRTADVWTDGNLRAGRTFNRNLRAGPYV
jgi:hypothetical protein